MLLVRAAVRAGHFDETLRLSLDSPREGYHGWHHFSRSDLRFAANETLTVETVQADWLGVTFGDWRGVQGVLWGLQLCGVPQTPLGRGCPKMRSERVTSRGRDP